MQHKTARSRKASFGRRCMVLYGCIIDERASRRVISGNADNTIMNWPESC